MEKFTKLISTCLPIRAQNIDTDQIVPARFLKITTREGFGKYLFYDWRFDKDGLHRATSQLLLRSPRSFSAPPKSENGRAQKPWLPAKVSVFDDPAYKNRKILVAGNNFGCGSSREHAVWAILDFGFRVVISSSFGDIFYNNSLKNGLLPVVLKPIELDKLFKVVENKQDTEVTVDLHQQTVSVLEGIIPSRKSRSDPTYHFDIDGFRKRCLLKGVDELGYILSLEEKINVFEKTHINLLSI